MTRAFDRLSPALQYQIVNGLGFRSLRPVQELSIGPVLDGKNCVVLAPTAGGKTEAAFFPLLSQMDTADWKPVSVLYVAPLRALINNLDERLEKYAALIGRRTFKWHGDVSTSRRQAFLNDPADLLLTTPESLEVMLMSRRVPAAQLFRHLRAVVIDEIHAFVSDDRGGHLSAVLERLCRIAGTDVQRIGLSATIGNPDDILAWAQGSSHRTGEVVRPPAQSKPARLDLDYVGSLENAAHVIHALHPGRKRLVFVDSRRRVEALGKLLLEHGVDTHVTHSSLAASERRAAEDAFASGTNCVIVATSALELGIDIGDLDHVIQIDAPSTVAGFLQRLGRTGRREDTHPNCTFLTTDDESLAQAAALLRLHAQGFVESLPLRRKAAHLLAHQIMALSIQEEGIPRSDYWGWIAPATPFQGLTESDRTALVEHMLAQDILHEDGGKLGLGERGEKLYGFRHFAELYSVFETPREFTVLLGTQEIGTIDVSFVESAGDGLLRFTLGARTWLAQDIDWKNAIVRVEPAPDAEPARWMGRPRLLSYELCQAIRQVLRSEDEDATWSRRARDQMTKVREEWSILSPSGLDLVAEKNSYRLFTFAGGRANNILAKTLESLLGEKVTADNFSVGFRGDAAKSEVGIRQTIEQLRDSGRPNDEDALRYASMCSRGRLSKFQPCLPEHLESAYLAEVVTEPERAR
ncbi:MAG: DEAD/DEAH box helicase [Polyangia bacterium]|jgi:ATP-dependent Lhr-like helicase|nr:DEAD/DEAH box helicase [Polyangia bacterium]